MTQVPPIEAHLTATSRQELHLSKTSLLCKLFVPNSNARCSYAPSTLHMKPQKPNFVLIVFLKRTCSYLHSQWSIKFWVILLPTPIHTLTYTQWTLATPAPDFFSLQVTVERFNIPKDKRLNIFSKDGHQLRLKVVTLQCQMKHVTLLFFFFFFKVKL